MPTFFALRAPALIAPSLLGLLLACGGGASTGAPGSPSAPAPLALNPPEARIKVGGEVRFQARDASGAPVAATYSVLSGDGAIDGEGRLKAPGRPGVHRIRAQAAADPARSAEATVRVEAYTGSVAAAPALAVPRSGHAATLLDTGEVLVLGGWASTLSERFDPRTGTFLDGPRLDVLRADATATALPGGRALVAGGEGAAGLPRTALVFGEGAFAPVPQAMDTPRRRHSATALLDGRVLLAGGLPVRGAEVEATDRAELFDPATLAFQPTGPMTAARTGHTATRLPDGRVLEAGGRDSTCEISCPTRFWASAELFDPRTGTFTPTGSMAITRHGHAATLLPDGRVLVAGGLSPDLQGTDLADSVEIYDPATGRFTPAGRMLKPRAEHQATLLGDGTVLLSGGRTEGEGSLATATSEAFDPATGASRLAASPRTTRYRHAAVRLESGEVLLVGGSEGGGPLASVERYQ